MIYNAVYWIKTQ